MRKNIFPIIVVTIVFLAACQPKKTQVPILSDSPCTPPCWLEITPGASTIDDVKQIIETLPLVQGKIIEWNDQATEITPRLRMVISDTTSVFIYFYNNKVAIISISGDLEYRFEEAVGMFGEPEFITVARFCCSDISWFRPRRDHIDVDGYQITKGIAYGYDEFNVPQKWQGKINPEIELRYFQFFDPVLFDKLADRGFFIRGGNLEETRAAMTPWKGYKSLGTDYPFAERIDK